MGEEVDLGYKRNTLGYTKKSDLHPLAVIYSIFATKYHPFDASSPTKIYANICNKPLQLQTSDDVPYDQRILDLINKLGAKDPANRPTAQEALDEARAIEEDIKLGKIVEDVIQKIMQDVIQIQNEKDVAKRARFLTWVRSLKNDANFKVQQLEQQLRAVTLARERERAEKEKLKREKDEADKKRKDALQMLEAKRQETLNEEKKKLEDDRKRFEEQQAEQRFRSSSNFFFSSFNVSCLFASNICNASLRFLSASSFSLFSFSFSVLSLSLANVNARNCCSSCWTLKLASFFKLRTQVRKRARFATSFSI